MLLSCGSFTTKGYQELSPVRFLKGSPRNRVHCSDDQVEWLRQRKSAHTGLWLGIVAFGRVLQ